MRGFSGFPARSRLVRLPSIFFSELLPEIDSLNELKVTLYCLWRLQEKEDQQPFLRQRELATDLALMQGLAPREDQRVAALEDGLERAVQRGTLIAVKLERPGGTDLLYFVNSERGRTLVAGLESGAWQPGGSPLVPIQAQVERPGLFTLYEQNIGPLTPLIADALGELADEHSDAKVEEALRIAARAGVRKLPYIEAILRRWQQEGKTDRSEPAADWQRFVSGKYGDEFEN